MEKGWILVFGSGQGKANYVAAGDVAEVSVRVLMESPRHDIAWVGGPKNFTAMEVVRTYERVSGRRARVYHVPEGLLRAVRRISGPLLPVVGRIVDAGLFMESGRQQIDPQETLARYPIRLTRLEEFVLQRYGGPPAGPAAPAVIALNGPRRRPPPR